MLRCPVPMRVRASYWTERSKRWIAAHPICNVVGDITKYWSRHLGVQTDQSLIWVKWSQKSLTVFNRHLVSQMILDTAAHRGRVPTVSGVAAEHRRKPLRAQLPLPDSQLSRVVHLRGWSQRVSLWTLQWNQLHSLQGRFLTSIMLTGQSFSYCLVMFEAPNTKEVVRVCRPSTAGWTVKTTRTTCASELRMTRRLSKLSRW